jgi:uncharacterized protein YgfB (UPF0149 family)
LSDLELKAQTASVTLSPQELHGMVVGFLAASACPTIEDFPITELVALAGDQALTDETAVLDFVDHSLGNLRDEDLGFTPLIADDDEPMAQRVDDLAGWCGSFLSGFAAANATGRDQLPVDIQEIIRDFATLSSMGSEVDFEDEDGESGQDEESFSEIYEFVRVSVLLVVALLDEQQPSVESDVVQ